VKIKTLLIPSTWRITDYTAYIVFLNRPLASVSRKGIVMQSSYILIDYYLLPNFYLTSARNLLCYPSLN